MNIKYYLVGRHIKRVNDEVVDFLLARHMNEQELKVIEDNQLMSKYSKSLKTAHKFQFNENQIKYRKLDATVPTVLDVPNTKKDLGQALKISEAYKVRVNLPAVKGALHDFRNEFRMSVFESPFPKPVQPAPKFNDEFFKPPRENRNEKQMHHRTSNSVTISTKEKDKELLSKKYGRCKRISPRNLINVLNFKFEGMNKGTQYITQGQIDELQKELENSRNNPSHLLGGSTSRPDVGVHHEEKLRSNPPITKKDICQNINPEFVEQELGTESKGVINLNKENRKSSLGMPKINVNEPTKKLNFECFGEKEFMAIGTLTPRNKPIDGGFRTPKGGGKSERVEIEQELVKAGINSQYTSNHKIKHKTKSPKKVYRGSVLSLESTLYIYIYRIQRIGIR